MFWVLIGLVTIAPLAIGAVYPWSWGLLAILVGVLLLSWCLRLVVLREAPAVSPGKVWPILLFFGVAVAWAALQMSSLLPPAWHHPLWAEAGGALATGVTGHVTVNPHETGSALLRLLSYGGVFWLALQYGRNRERAKHAFYALTIAGLAYAAYGLAVEFTGAKMILWFPKTSYQDNLTSTFVNRNSYSTYAGLGLLCATGLLIHRISITLDHDAGRRERLRLLLGNLAASGWLALLAWFYIATALLLTESRGGVVSASIGMATLLIAFAAARTISRRYAAVLAAIVLAGGVALFAQSGGTVSERLAGTELKGQERLRVYDTTTKAISDTPWLGTGYGTFPGIFRIYRDRSIPNTYKKAHNSYLESALELGIPAAIALILAVGTTAFYCLIGIRRRRRDVIYPAVGLAATVLVAAHSLVDFSLQIPAVAVTYSLLMGVACAQSWRSDRGQPGG